MKTNARVNTTRPGRRPAPDPRRHSRQCEICHHPQREAIDDEFLHWQPPDYIVEHYKLPSRSALYRHAHATGIYDDRRFNTRHALDNIIEESARCTPNGHVIIAAIRAYSRLNDEGRWVDPPKHVMVTHRSVLPPPPAPPQPELLPAGDSPGAPAALPATPEASAETPAAAPAPAAAPVAAPVPAAAPAAAPPSAVAKPPQSAAPQRIYGFIQRRNRPWRQPFLAGTPEQVEIVTTSTKQTIEPNSTRDKIDGP